MDAPEDLLLDDEFLDTSCIADEQCVEQLIEAAPDGCLYCMLRSLDEDED